MNDINSGFGRLLKQWRQRRGLSQLALAHRAATTQRHVSFVELGRAAPSREMVLRLATALDVPLREHNQMLLAAGYAPAWKESPLDAPELIEIGTALQFMLTQQEPYPAVVVDRYWRLLRANAAAVRMVEFLVGPLPPGAEINLADALVGPDVLRPFLSNWEDVAAYFIRSIEADAAFDGSPLAATLRERLLSYPDVRALQTRLPPSGVPVLAMRFFKDGTALNLFTTLATLGNPLDVTLQELRVESFFPADDATVRLFASWAEKG